MVDRCLVVIAFWYYLEYVLWDRVLDPTCQGWSTVQRHVMASRVFRALRKGCVQQTLHALHIST